MNKLYAKAFGVSIVVLLFAPRLLAQCSTTQANTCACQTAGATNCDLLPDIMISWQAITGAGPTFTYPGLTEYSQTSTNTSGNPGTANAGRLRVTGATPNVGHGPLEVRGVNAAGYRKFLCGTEVDSVYAPTSNPGFTCPNGFRARQILFQRIYHKNGNTMTYTDTERGTMTYHSGHGHYHIDGWTTLTLRMQQPGVSDPLQWPVIATGGKLGFCLINLFTCSGSPGYCRTSNLFNQGTTLTNTSFGSNYNLGQTPYSSCGDDAQGIYVGAGDIYSQSLDGMWIDMMPGLCNNLAGDNAYWLVAEAEPNNDFIEENELNNWAAVPVNLSAQAAHNSGGTANISCDGSLVIGPGQTRTLTASPGTAYLWSTGATARSITVSTAGNYSCTVTCPCGSLATPTLTLTALPAPPAPVGTGAVVLNPSAASLSATGSDLHWFDNATAGIEVGAGGNFTTPVLSTTTNYWVEARSTSAGVNAHVAKPDNTGGGGYASTKSWMYFDASQPFTLQSFVVYANSVGIRHFVLVDRLGDLIAEKVIEIPAGLNTITVNWRVPAGTQHKITAFDDNSEVVQDLYRNNAGVAFPYSLGSVGSITGSSSAGMYFYLYDWVVRTDDVTATSARTIVTATVTDGVVPDVKVLFEGPFDPQSGRMNDGLRSAGLIPAGEPFTGLGFTHAGGGGGETISAGLLTTTGDNAIVDWVLIELRSAAQPSQIVATRSALVTRIGQVISTTGSPLRLPALNGNYYVAVRHRNHMGCMTSAPVALSATPVTIDFRASSTATWGTAARKQDGSNMLLWAGNVLRDQSLLYMGSGNDRDPILAVVGGSVPTNTVPGYMLEDTNLDGVVKYTGGANDRDVILANIGGSVPTATRTEQLP
ncbi:MAG: hypothetical protein ABI432_09115 [Flavobacteriales bacterium]